MTKAQHKFGSLHPVSRHQYPGHEIQMHRLVIIVAIEIEHHPSNMDREEGFFLSKS
jgi:hypothetical protein